MRLDRSHAIILLLAAMLLSAPLVAQEAAAPGGGNQTAPAGPRYGRRGGAFLGGTISSVGVDQFVVQRRDGTPLTVHVDDQTQFSDQGKPIQLEDLKAGERVMIRPRAAEGETAQPGATAAGPAPGSVTAAMVRVLPATPATAFNGQRTFGQIVAISGNQLTVQNRQGEKVIVVSSDAVVRKDGQPATVEDFKVGDRVFALGQETNGKFVASHLMGGVFRRRGEGSPSGGPGGPLI